MRSHVSGHEAASFEPCMLATILRLAYGGMGWAWCGGLVLACGGLVVERWLVLVLWCACVVRWGLVGERSWMGGGEGDIVIKHGAVPRPL